MINLPAYPLALDGERLALRHDLPKLGEHNAEILSGTRLDRRPISSCNARAAPA